MRISGRCQGEGRDSVATVYTLLKNGIPVYCGSTSKDVETRIKWHYNTLGQMREWNPDLAEFLAHCQGFPEYQVIAEVAEDERFDKEAEFTEELRKLYDLYNVKNGTRHTPESVKRILAGKARAKLSRETVS